MVLKPEILDRIGRWSSALALVVGAFALTQVLSSGGRGRHLERWSVAILVGLSGVFLVNRLVPFELHHLHELAALFAGFFLGWFAHLRFSTHCRTGTSGDT
jgi:hypothetical protein